MATVQQVDTVLSSIREFQPQELVQAFNDGRNGGHAVLKLLYLSEGTVTAGMIAQHMGVSTARIAVLLKKLCGKGLIEKHRAPNDARITVVRLTEKGLSLAEQMHEQMRQQIGAIIDQIGMEKLQEFLSTAQQIRSVLAPPATIL